MEQKRPYVTGKARTPPDPLEQLLYHSQDLEQMGQINLGILRNIRDGYIALKAQSDEQVVGLVTVSNNLGQLIAAVRNMDTVGKLTVAEQQASGLPSYSDSIKLVVGIANLLAKGASDEPDPG